MPLTDVKCRNAKGQIKPYKLSDGGGLHLLVNADGAKYWRLAYRWHGKQRTLALGVYKRLSDAMKANDELRRKLQQGSQQLQGEVLELALEDLISQTFPSDLVQPVPKGINGADIIQ